MCRDEWDIPTSKGKERGSSLTREGLLSLSQSQTRHRGHCSVHPWFVDDSSRTTHQLTYLRRYLSTTQPSKVSGFVVFGPLASGPDCRRTDSHSEGQVILVPHFLTTLEKGGGGGGGGW